MNELIYQLTFDEQGKAIGHIILANMFGLEGLIFSFEDSGIPRNWRNKLMEDIFAELLSAIIVKDECGEVPLTDQQKYIREDSEWFQFEWENALSRSNLYIYSHTPTKPGGYVRVLTEPDANEDVQPKIDEQGYFPKEVSQAGPVEKFLFDFAGSGYDDACLFFDPPLRLNRSKQKCAEYIWNFGDGLQLDSDIHELYFYDTVAWNELYWDLRQSVGRPWKGCDYMEAWRTSGYETEKKLTAETDAQRLLFWCMENDYSLDDLYQMVSEKRILTKRFLGPWQESILQYPI